MGFVSWGIVRVGLLLVLTLPFSTGDTDPRDVSAINRLYTSLGSPPLLGWIPAGGDPCGEGWQGVSCVFSNITELRLSGLNLGGILDEGIGDFESILIMDLSHNQIGGSIPSNIPLTIRNLFLSGNQFNGSIPVTLSALTQLTQLFLDDNRLSDNIPDSFQELRSLADLDLSGNNLTGQLPPSFGNLSSLTTLHLQNNKISGVLNVLQDLPLSDLNVENNKLSGPIPPKLLNIPNFRKDGNPFNTTILPSPPAALPPFIAWAPSPLHGPPRGRPADGPSSSLVLPQWSKGRVFWTNKRVIVIAAAGIITLIVLGVVLLLVLRCFRGNKDSNKHGANAYNSSGKKLNQVQKSSSRPAYQTEKVDKATVMRPMDGYGLESGDTGISPNLQDEQLLDANTRPASSRHQKNHEINKGGLDVKSLSIQPPLPPPLLPTVEEASVSPIIPTEVNGPGRSSRGRDSCSLDVTAFTIALLQQYTNSFAEENFIGEGMLGGVYRAELPDGKLLAIKKLDTRASRWKTDAEFLQLISTISKLRHPNIVELVGYCNEHGQRLSWNARVDWQLGSFAKKPFTVQLAVRCLGNAVVGSIVGLLALQSEFSGSLFVSYGYAAPEIEFGSYTCQSDVYSLGVVMLELLTGRESFDRSRPLGEQFLVRWAIQQLHDIDALVRMVDITLNGVYPVKSLSRFADIISRCVQSEPGFRPPISEIVQDLLHMI
ncbi:hypothetical protein GOBAR_AA15761 [Gossypium barbadense]|uniref:Protein kinase domain-containing protein n=1 Tax=Gossypium barbadense TaxID=3634 RepID=A0A2P5XNF8_GOSBA|nr:hypothetical protein GOBAR_AA15761 [Gossypium barbadense]